MNYASAKKHNVVISLPALWNIKIDFFLSIDIETKAFPFLVKEGFKDFTHFASRHVHAAIKPDSVVIDENF